MTIETPQTIGSAVNRLTARAARVGFVAKGMVAVVIGAVALRLALGDGGGLIGPEGALRRFVGAPPGRATLAFLALGLLAHAAWKLVQALLDPERKGRGIAALAERLAFAVAGLGYAALAIAAGRLALGEMPGPPSDPDAFAARVLTPWLGRGVVGLAGIIGMVMGILQIRLGLVAGFRDIFDLDDMRRGERIVMLSLGGAGYVALGVITTLIGWFLLRVAVLFDPAKAGGWSDALGFLARLGDTRWPLGLVAAGLVAYGLYFMLQARYRRIDPVAGPAARR